MIGKYGNIEKLKLHEKNVETWVERHELYILINKKGKKN